MKKSNQKNKLILTGAMGTLYNSRWSYEAREINIKKGLNNFLYRVIAEKTNSSYSLFLEDSRYPEDGRIPFKPEETVDLSDSKQVDTALKNKLRQVARSYMEEHGSELEDKAG